MQTEGSDVDAFCSFPSRHHRPAARLVMGSEPAMPEGHDRTDGHGITQRHGASLTPLLVHSAGAETPLFTGGAATITSGAWVITGEHLKTPLHCVVKRASEKSLVGVLLVRFFKCASDWFLLLPGVQVPVIRCLMSWR